MTQTAAATIGRQVEVLGAGTAREIDTAFASAVQKRVGGLMISADAFLFSRRTQLVSLAAFHRLPAIYPGRVYADAGGLMSYSTNSLERNRQAGHYTGRILKGEKPTDLPILRATKFEFVINLQTARMLGLEVPPGLLAIADEVIE
jgi:putative ABC transport system substrate-binding protein